MRIYAHKVIFDEVQKVPEFFNLIKIAIDNDRQNPGKFVLTGSSQFNFIKGVTESLAGRIGLLTQLPYQIAEMPKELLNESEKLLAASTQKLINSVPSSKDACRCSRKPAVAASSPTT